MLDFVLSFLTCNNIMHILPLPLCGLYSIRAQNGYWQHVVCPCKIVLLTLVAPRGVTDLYLSWGIHIEHARTAYHETCRTEYQPAYRRCNSHTHYKRNIAKARPMSVSDVSRSLQSWVSTTHRSYSQLTFFNIFIKKIKPSELLFFQSIVLALDHFVHLCPFPFFFYVHLHPTLPVMPSTTRGSRAKVTMFCYYHENRVAK